MCPTGLFVLKFQIVTCSGSNYIKHLQKVPFSGHNFVKLENDAKLKKIKRKQNQIDLQKIKISETNENKMITIINIIFIDYSYND